MQNAQDLHSLSSAECKVKTKRDRDLFRDILQFAAQKEFRSELAENAVEALMIVLSPVLSPNGRAFCLSYA